MQDTSAQHTCSSAACSLMRRARALQVFLPEPPAWLQEPALERGAGWALRAAALLAVQTAAATVPLLVWNLVAAASGAGLTCARVCSPAAPSRPRSTTQPLLVLPGPFARRATRLRKGAPRAGALAWRRCCQSCMRAQRSLNMPRAVTLGLQELDSSWWYASAQPELQAEQLFYAQRRPSAARSAEMTRRCRGWPRDTAGAGCASSSARWRSSLHRHKMQPPPCAAHPAAGPSPSLEPAPGAGAKQEAPGWGWRQLRGGLLTGRLHWVSNRAASPTRAARSVSTPAAARSKLQQRRGRCGRARGAGSPLRIRDLQRTQLEHTVQSGVKRAGLAPSGRARPDACGRARPQAGTPRRSGAWAWRPRAAHSRPRCCWPPAWPASAWRRAGARRTRPRAPQPRAARSRPSCSPPGARRWRRLPRRAPARRCAGVPQALRARKDALANMQCRRR